MATILETKKVVKRFGGLLAVDHLDLHVDEGEIVGLIGPNGSGKTTVMNCITGVYLPEEGSVLFNGQEIRGKAPHEVAELGISRTFQNIRVMGPLSVYDNVRLGMHFKTKANLFHTIFALPFEKKENKMIEKTIDEALEIVGLSEYKNEYVKNMPYGRQKVMEIARAIVSKPKLLLLDEPAAGLNSAETEELADIVKKIAKTGISILLIEHEMQFVSALAERVVVINYGHKIAEGTYNEIKVDPEVITAYLGSDDEEE